jgi:hypothetical protein
MDLALADEIARPVVQGQCDAESTALPRHLPLDDEALELFGAACTEARSRRLDDLLPRRTLFWSRPRDLERRPLRVRDARSDE